MSPFEIESDIIQGYIQYCASLFCNNILFLEHTTHHQFTQLYRHTPTTRSYVLCIINNKSDVEFDLSEDPVKTPTTH